MMKIGPYQFSDPTSLGWGYICPCAGVYAILRRNATDYSVIYIGQSSNMAERVDSGHHKWSCFLSHGANHVAFVQMPYSTEAERLAVEATLIRMFDPPCNG